MTIIYLPKCTEAVSEMYIIFPSEAKTKINPSKVCNKCDPSSFINSGRLLIDGLHPQPSPRPEKIQNIRSIHLIKHQKQISEFHNFQVRT